MEETEMMLASIVRCSDDAIIGKTSEGNISSWNFGAEKIFGYSAAEAIGQSIIMLVPPERANEEKELLERIRRGERIEHFETVRVRKDGARIDVSVTLSPMKDKNGKIVGASKIARDITESNRLKTQLGQLSRIVEQSPNSILITDATGTIEYVNPKFVAITGYSSEEAVGQNPRILKSGKSKPEVYQEMWATITAGKEWHGEFLNKRKNGELYWELASISPVLDKLGKVTHYVAIKEDITARKRAEQALVESEQKFRTLFEAANDAIFILQDGRYVDCNSKGLELLGMSRRQIMGQKTFFQPPQDQPGGPSPGDKTVVAREKVHEEVPAAFECLIHRRDGTPVTVECSNRTFKLNGEMYVQSVVRDITDRKKVEEQLRWKTAFFEAQVHSSTDGILVVDNAGRRLLHNQRLVELWDIPKEVIDDPDDNRRFEWVTKQNKDPRQFVERAAYLYAHPDEISFDEIELANGKCFDRYAAPVRGKDGKHYGRIWFYRDVSERKRTEESLRLFRALIEQSNDGIYVVDAETGQFLDCNALASERLGYGHEEMLSLCIHAIVVGVPPLPELVNEIKASGFKIIQARHRRKDGSTFPVETSVQYIHLDRGYLVAVSRDITERKRAEEQIAEQAAVLDEARDAIMVRDLEGRVLYWNHGAERTHGWTGEEVLGRNISEMLYPEPSDFVRIRDEILDKGEWSGEIVHLTKDRREIIVEVHATLICDNEGRPKSLLSINTDITEKKKIEAQFMRAQRMESIGTLAGGIAHDLNNILAPIMMSIEMLKQTSTDEQSSVILNAIEDSAKRGADIVRQVLSFSRGLEGERIEIQPKHLLKDLEKVIQDIFPKEIEVEFQYRDDTWLVLGDPPQVQQVLLNLAVNARDAMPNGGVLNIGVENCTLDEHYAAMNLDAKAGRYVMISVSDSGLGMTPELLGKIFEPFFTTKVVTKGTGLGLSSSMAIVKSHGGNITVVSEPGKGTTFKVYLPATEADVVGEPEKPEESRFPRGNGETVLVVDDEASILTITSQTLQAFGYRVLTSTDGAEGVSIYAEHQSEIAVVLTDMMMPVMDGAMMINALTEINPSVKIIASSGVNAKGSIIKEPGTRAKCFLGKPYTSATLLKALRLILDQT